MDLLGRPLPNPILESLSLLRASYEIGDHSTKGGNGYVFFGRNKILKRSVVIKYYFWGDEEKYHAEPQQIAQIDSPCVVSIFECAAISGGWAYFITPHYACGDIDQWVAANGLPSVHNAMDQAMRVLTGLCELHMRDCIHRDIKAANVFVTDQHEAVIGDFGSLRKLVAGEDDVPGSGHAVLYRPPESILTNRYGVRGDLYQVGILLYQLFGGYLPYEPTAWLTKRDRAAYDAEKDEFEKAKIIDSCIMQRACKGTLLKWESLPPVVGASTLRMLRKATNPDPAKRFSSSADFLEELRGEKNGIHNWIQMPEGWTTVSDPAYRIRKVDGAVAVEKSRGGGVWRREHAFNSGTDDDAVSYVLGRLA